LCYLPEFSCESRAKPPAGARARLRGFGLSAAIGDFSLRFRMEVWSPEVWNDVVYATGSIDARDRFRFMEGAQLSAYGADSHTLHASDGLRLLEVSIPKEASGDQNGRRAAGHGSWPVGRSASCADPSPPAQCQIEGVFVIRKNMLYTHTVYYF
jgi:hypothetical protein